MAHLEKNQGEMAEPIGTTRGQIAHYVKGRTPIQRSTALAWQAVFGVNAEWLMGGSGEPFLTNTDFQRLSKHEKGLVESFRRLGKESRQSLRDMMQFLEHKEQKTGKQ